MEPFLKLHRLCKNFDGTQVLDNVCLGVVEGEFLSILGQSGSGKTTLLRLIAGFDPPNQGEISMEGHIFASNNVFVPPESRGIAVVFQDHALWPHMTVFENIAFPLRVQKKSKQHITTEVDSFLGLMELENFAHTLPHELSGGQSQRVALARALIQKPRLILFDEPLASLDSCLRFELQGALKRLQKLHTFTSIYITHDQHEAMRLSDRIAVLEKGSITQCASPLTLYTMPATRHIAELFGQSVCVPVTLHTIEETQNKKISQARVTLDAFTFQVKAPRNPSTLLCIKSENISFCPEGEGIPMGITECSFMGDSYLLSLQSMSSPTYTLYKKSTTPHQGRVFITLKDAWLVPQQ